MRKAFPWLRIRSEPGGLGEGVLTGKKVVIRGKCLEDASDDFAWRMDEELARLDATTPLTMSYEAFLRYSRDEVAYPNPTSQRLSIDTLDGHHIGNCMYYDIDLKRGEAELGIMIGDRNYWGKGYGTDSVDTLLIHIFTSTIINRVYLHTLDWNTRARRAFAKSGFREVESVRRGGMDFILMEVCRPEWERRQACEEPPPSQSQQLSHDDRPLPDEGPPTEGA